MDSGTEQRADPINVDDGVQANQDTVAPTTVTKNVNQKQATTNFPMFAPRKSALASQKKTTEEPVEDLEEWLAQENAKTIAEYQKRLIAKARLEARKTLNFDAEDNSQNEEQPAFRHTSDPQVPSPRFPGFDNQTRRSSRWAR